MLKIYQLIEKRNIEGIREYLEKNKDVHSVSFLTILDLLEPDHDLFEKLKKHCAIIDYEELLTPGEKIEDCVRINSGIKLLIKSWRSNELFNNALKNHLNKIAVNRIISLWLINPINENEIVLAMNLETNRYVIRSTVKWYLNELESDTLKELNDLVVRDLLYKLKKNDQFNLNSLLKSTFLVHRTFSIINCYKKNQLPKIISQLIQKKLENEFLHATSKEFSIKNEKMTFLEILQDWKNNLLPISLCEQLEAMMAHILEEIEFTDEFSLQIDLITLHSMLDLLKERKLDIYLIKYLRKVMNDIFNEYFIEQLRSYPRTQELEKIAENILNQWKSGELEIHSPFHLEKHCFPDLYKAKQHCKKEYIPDKTQSSVILEEVVRENQEEISKIKRTIARLPQLISGFVKYHLEEKNSLENTEKHRVSMTFSSNDVSQSSSFQNGVKKE